MSKPILISEPLSPDENKRLFTIDWERIPIEIPLENVIKLIKINIQTCKEHLNIRKFKNVNPNQDLLCYTKKI